MHRLTVLGLFMLASTAAAQVPPPVTAPAVAATPTGDARDAATTLCVAEAKSRALAVGATNVTLNKVEDTDKKSDKRVSIRAKVNVVTTQNDKVKVNKKTIKCDTRNGVISSFEWD